MQKNNSDCNQNRNEDCEKSLQKEKKSGCSCSCGLKAIQKSDNNNSKSPKDGKSVKRKRIIVISTIIAIVALTIGISAIVDGINGIKATGNFISEQILGMQWLNSVIGMALTAIFGEQFTSGRFGGALQFFIYDTIKIIVLLCLLIFIISYIQSYFPPERTKKLLGNKKGIGANIFGALLGTVTPFCSCSSIPIFMGFTRAGLTSGVTFSFLISSPLVDLGRLCCCQAYSASR